MWSWLVPLVGCAAVFCFVLLTTPPGFGALGGVVFVSSRGPQADAAAYAVAAAASLALLTLVVLGGVCLGASIAIGRLHSRASTYNQEHDDD